MHLQYGGNVDCANAPLQTLPVFNPHNPRMLEVATIQGCKSSLPNVSWNSIDLSGNDLTHVPSTHFISLSWLERLTLAHNKLTIVPVLVSPYLEMLFLNNNPITYMPPSAFVDLPLLRELNLREIASLNSDAFVTNSILCTLVGITLQLEKDCDVTTTTTTTATTSASLVAPLNNDGEASQPRERNNTAVIGGGIAAVSQSIYSKPCPYCIVYGSFLVLIRPRWLSSSP